MASATGTFTLRDIEAPKRWLAVLHLFEPDGTHRRTEVDCSVFCSEGDAAIEQVNAIFEARLIDLVLNHGAVKGDIWVKPFEVEIDGLVHGLIYERDDDDPDDPSEWVILEPRDIMFHPPWDSGEYST